MKNSKENSRQRGSVTLVAMGTLTILMLVVAVTILSTTNKYFTAYQWASWQEALQGAESGADIAMAEMRKDIDNDTTTIPWIGWNLGNYGTDSSHGSARHYRDTSTYRPIDTSGYFADNNGLGGGNSTQFTLAKWLSGSFSGNFDYITYSTQLSPHAGEGNQNLRITVTIDKPASLKDSGNRQWLRVRATGTTDLAGPTRVSEEKLDNRLRKLGLFWDKILAATDNTAPATHQTTRQIELVAKPVTMFAGALTSMVQIKSDGQGVYTDSFNSEDRTHWPVNSSGDIDLTVSHDPTNALGKNGDIASNAFPIQHDHSQNLDLHNDMIWGDVGNNYSQIKGLDPTYYSTSPNGTTNPYGLDNGNFGAVNPSPTLIKTDGSGDVAGAIATNFYRDLPPIQDPNITNPNGWAITATSSLINTKSGTNYIVNNKTNDIPAGSISTDPNHPTRIIVSNITLAASDKWTIHAPPMAKGWVAGMPPTYGYVEIWVNGGGDAIKLDDGGGVILEAKYDGAGNQQTGVNARIYVDHNIKIGETKETKSNMGGFDVQSDDAKDLLIFGVTQPDSGKLPKDDYVDPLGNDSLYTPYKASGNIVFTETDFTGAIYAPDHNIVFSNSADGRGKRHKRHQGGADFYGSYVGRTINNKKGTNIHFDESLNDSGPQLDWGYVSWFEDVDVDNR